MKEYKWGWSSCFIDFIFFFSFLFCFSCRISPTNLSWESCKRNQAERQGVKKGVMGTVVICRSEIPLKSLANG